MKATTLLIIISLIQFDSQTLSQKNKQIKSLEIMILKQYPNIMTDDCGPAETYMRSLEEDKIFNCKQRINGKAYCITRVKTKRFFFIKQSSDEDKDISIGEERENELIIFRFTNVSDSKSKYRYLGYKIVPDYNTMEKITLSADEKKFRKDESIWKEFHQSVLDYFNN